MGSAHRRPRYWLAADADNASESTVAIDVEVASVPEIERIDPWEEGPHRVLGMDDGAAHRMDRARAVGNGQVPIVAATAWSALA
jgi:hypothetical protein